MLREIYKAALKLIPVSERGLVHSGFTKNGDDWYFGTLIVFSGKYYYGMDGQRVMLKNMQQVSDLVYGHTPFLDMSNA